MCLTEPALLSYQTYTGENVEYEEKPFWEIRREAKGECEEPEGHNQNLVIMDGFESFESEQE